jgi:aromatic ring-opening dioxygenase catalytic subunit (LigB family)
MKRSEMLEKIEDSIFFEIGPSPGSKKLADEILQEIEKEMIPKARNADQKSDYGYARVYEWDTE